MGHLKNSSKNFHNNVWTQVNGFNPHSESSSTLGQSNDQMNLNNQMNHLNNLNSSAHMTRSTSFFYSWGWERLDLCKNKKQSLEYWQRTVGAENSGHVPLYPIHIMFSHTENQCISLYPSALHHCAVCIIWRGFIFQNRSCNKIVFTAFFN